MQKIMIFIKKETVLCIALLLAVVSAFMIPPDGEYIDYIDFHTLSILFCLMSVMTGLQEMGVFERIARRLLGKVKSGLSVVLILVLLCFFSSMLITNDVALITFVPFTFIVLNMLGEEARNRMALKVVVMQTIAANLGSMLTPIGNPQNLYLYGRSGMSMGNFLLLMLPYTLCSLVLLLGWGVISGMCQKDMGRLQERNEMGFSGQEALRLKRIHPMTLVYGVLLFVCILSVGRVIPWWAALAAVLFTLLIMGRKVLRKVDYSLLLTFVGFFVFIGNMGRIPLFRDFLQNIILEREVITSVVASQVISNVPAALLLSGFTDDFGSLIIGTNLGGLGTLIASMASLISYKYVGKVEGNHKGMYMVLFTTANIIFLGALLGLYVVLN